MRCHLLVVLLLSFCHATSAAADTIHAKWIQLVQAPAVSTDEFRFPVQALVRLVTAPTADCPTLRINQLDGTPLPLSERANPAPNAFPVKVCQALVPRSADSLTLYFADGSSLQVPALQKGMTLESVAVLGDSGCRGPYKQDCDDTEEWPFRQIAHAAAGFAGQGTKAPDLVIHVGDYVYRGGGNWLNWKLDFFDPAQVLLAAAPWVMVRGNHETCNNNSGQGYLLFLDPDYSGNTVSCYKRSQTPYISETYALDVTKELRLIVFDSANANPFANGTDTVLADNWQKMIKNMVPEARKRKAWYLSHVPLWGVGEEDGESVRWADNDILRTPESQFPLINPVTAVIVADLHMFEVTTFPDRPERPTQYVVGNSGVKLDKSLPTDKTSEYLKNLRIKTKGDRQSFKVKAQEVAGGAWVKWHGTAVREHGFMTIERHGKRGWKFGLQVLDDGRFKARSIGE